MSHNDPYLFKQIRHIAYHREHDLHKYINFDDGPPVHLNECPHRLRKPTLEEFEAASDRRSESLGNRFLARTCSHLLENFVTYGKIGSGS